MLRPSLVFRCRINGASVIIIGVISICRLLNNFVFSEDQARTLLRNMTADVKSESSGDILNNTGTMEYHQATRQLSVTFRNMVS